MPNIAPDTLHVAVGVIERDGCVLLARRAAHRHQGGLWEFPGGKVEPGETAQLALQRELREELGLEVDIAGLEPLLEVSHAYPDLSVMLDVWWVGQFTGQEYGREGQPLVWAAAEDLMQWSFPPANHAIIRAVQRRMAGLENVAQATP